MILIELCLLLVLLVDRARLVEAHFAVGKYTASNDVLSLVEDLCSLVGIEALDVRLYLFMGLYTVHFKTGLDVLWPALWLNNRDGASFAVP